MSTIQQAEKPLKIFFHTQDGLGRINASIGMAQTMAERGHQIIFVVNSCFKDTLDKYGFRTIPLFLPSNGKDDRKQPQNLNPIKEAGENLKKRGLLSGLETLEKYQAEMDSEDNPFLKGVKDKLLHFDPQIERAIMDERPDFMIIDNFLLPPSILKCGIPWAYLNSGNPLPIFASPELPPRASGYATTGDRAQWKLFKHTMDFTFTVKRRRYQTELYEAMNYKPTAKQISLDNREALPFSEYLNIYDYPAELDYDDVVARPETMFRVDAFDYKNPEEEVLNPPDEFRESRQDSKLIYFSLGTMASIDLDVMHRLLNIFAKTPHRFIVSKGPLGDELKLPKNCWGENTLPQSKVLPLVDLVITHGGNNTLTESMASSGHGKPLIVLPFFADQPDNAQRITEKKCGLRFNPYLVEESVLIDALEKLLNDDEMKIRLKNISERIQREKSKVKCCEVIEEMVRKFSSS